MTVFTALLDGETILLCLLFFVLYRTYQQNKNLKSQLQKARQMLDKQKQEIDHLRGSPMVSADERALQEISQATKNLDKKTSSNLDEVYWKKLEKLTEKTSKTGEQRMLEERRQQLRKMIDLAKEKFHRRELDEKSYSNIVEEYQKEIISLESQINKISQDTH